MERIRDNMVVSHFKRSKDKPYDSGSYLYHVINTNVIHTETNERMVLYESIDIIDGFVELGTMTYVRPYDMFMSEVDREKYPNATQKYRFEEYNFIEINKG